MRPTPLLFAAVAMGDYVLSGQSDCDSGQVIDMCINNDLDLTNCPSNSADSNYYSCYCMAYMKMSRCYYSHCPNALPNDQMIASIHYCAAGATAVVAAITAVPTAPAAARAIATTSAVGGATVTTREDAPYSPVEDDPIYTSSAADQDSSSPSISLSLLDVIWISAAAVVGGVFIVIIVSFYLVKVRVSSNAKAAARRRSSATLVNELINGSRTSIYGYPMDGEVLHLHGPLSKSGDKRRSSVYKGQLSKLGDERRSSVYKGQLSELGDERRSSVYKGHISKSGDDRRSSIYKGHISKPGDDRRSSVYKGHISKPGDERRSSVYKGHISSSGDDRRSSVYKGPVSKSGDERRSSVYKGPISKPGNQRRMSVSKQTQTEFPSQGMGAPADAELEAGPEYFNAPGSPSLTDSTIFSSPPQNPAFTAHPAVRIPRKEADSPPPPRPEVRAALATHARPNPPAPPLPLSPPSPSISPISMIESARPDAEDEFEDEYVVDGSLSAPRNARCFPADGVFGSMDVVDSRRTFRHQNPFRTPSRSAAASPTSVYSRDGMDHRWGR